ncbi:hypothetical protein OSTOST_04723 [Ostertagia ostertagi]
MKDKTKKWELIAVKGKASYLKNRSQRLLKDRMSKYRLVDNRGMVVEDMHEEEPSTSSSVPSRPSTSKNGPAVSHLTSHIWGTGPEAIPRITTKRFGKISEYPSTSSSVPSRPSTSKNGPAVSHLTSHIWGTGPEAIPRSQQKDSEKFLNTSLAPSAIAPCAPRTPCLRRCPPSKEGEPGWNDTSSGYATMNGDLPMSTPKNYDNAVRAYENCQGLPIPETVDAVLDEVTRNARGVSSNAPASSATISAAVLETSICSSVNSSLAVDSHSLASRMELTTLPNVTRFSEVAVKEEPGESPPPDALPSPPQFDQTMNACQRDDAAGGKVVGEKEREEFWALGIAEMKKGHEIIETRSKIEGLQKQLFEATTFLQQLEVEMNEILRRKSELLGLPVPSTLISDLRVSWIVVVVRRSALLPEWLSFLIQRGARIPMDYT